MQPPPSAHIFRLAWITTVLSLSLCTTLGCQSLLATDDPTVHTGDTVVVSCVGCHKPNYDSATSPNHTALQLPTACETCHIKASWRPAKWDHQTWPLDGAHTQTTCAKCHGTAPNRVAKPPRDCAGCHLSSYQATTAPSHVNANYPKTCADCHTTAAWVPASFNHATWPLKGAHAKTTCAKCHGTAPNRVAKPPRDCAGCHLPNYKATTNPNHAGSGFPQTCATCHTETAWKPASLPNHTFPIKWGKHSGIACATCHNNPSNIKIFSCITSGCHGKADTDGEHWGEVNGYVYESSACYKCHPSGDSD